MENTNVTASSQVAQVENQNLEDEKDSLSVVDFKMVTFSLAGKDYAIDIMNIKEIAKAGRFTYVPNTMPFVIGVYNLRGDIIPIIDLRKFFNIDVPPREDGAMENMLIVSVEDQVFGVVVDAIDKVLGIQKSTIQPPHPLFGDINIKYIYGVVESAEHLYILLDIEKIFNSKIASKEPQAAIADDYTPPVSQAAAETASETPAAEAVEKTEEAKAPEIAQPKQDTAFVIEELVNLKKFYISEYNKEWFNGRFGDWCNERKDNTQLQSAADADEFLKTFWSQNNGVLWDKNYADQIYNMLPENNAKQIVVWNPGCGKGYESFSLACVLKKRYPDSKIRVYAHETDLLSVSNAPLLNVPDSYAQDWYAPYVTKKVSGEYTFTQEIKDIIMFEYHDIKNSNALPMVDIIFARDVISLLPPDAQSAVIADFDEKLKGNGVIFLGENETIGSGMNWGEKTVGSLTYYNKQ